MAERVTVTVVLRNRPEEQTVPSTETSTRLVAVNWGLLAKPELGRRRKSGRRGGEAEVGHAEPRWWDV